jgi:dTDP-4-amino-4,6-dideoxygalactose transaminase
MDEILKIAKKHGIIVIEDAAHALSASYKERKVGTIGDVTCFSFYATKNLTTGEGGMITTANNELAEKMGILRLHEMSKDAWKRYSPEGSWYYEILYPGYKYNMTDVQSAIGIHQLEKLPKMQERREAIARRYNEAFSDVPEIVTPTVKKYVRHAWHLYPVQINRGMLKIDRAKFVERFFGQKI